ncbi:alpha/beta hydrolase [Kaistella flava (ex Peng et al. 2021)]|uniref:Alpha/beta hydrolase n=1 Tax=Kaistella flava (ex Peng et al. 2021) TaxID=2038776 RepID=A0A7M2Y836_9FLAO|nr:alpha/beta hydrolase [Kaistella flava (ex Peng et al. 2021)]QOW10427.1 alpha/beta hydrolase [Kaistella flava (ex Peng et al. 2021)]
MKKYSALFAVLFINLIYSQIKKDPTFSLNSAFQKEIKKFPFIKKVEFLQSSEINFTSDIIYKKVGNHDLKLDAFINKNSISKPAVILIHGGGWKSGSKEMQNPMAQKIALLGYQTFTVEYRLSDEAKYPASINDIRDAILFLKKNRKKFKIDATKIALLGCSSGGQIVSLIGTKYPAEINAVIDIDGLLSFHHPDSEEGEVAALWLGGTYEEVPKVWQDASALSHVSATTPPFLFINSQFKRFSAGQNDFITKLNEFGIYFQVEKIENSPHPFWLFEPWFEPTIKYISNFLNVNFKINQNENL